MAISATQTHTNFHYFLRYFSRLHRTNFSQIPQELFTELIGLALLFLAWVWMTGVADGDGMSDGSD